jgi:hypothetical protein
MPDSRIVTIHKRIATLAGSDYSLKYSGVDMSGRVIRGSTIEPPYTPFICVLFIEADSDYGPTLGRFNYVAKFEIYAYIGGSDQSARFDNAMNLCSDIIESLTANRQLSLGTDVDDVLCSFTAIDGEKYGLNQIGIGYIQVECKCQSDTGV